MIELRLNESFAAESGPEVVLGRGRESSEQDRFDHHLTRQVQMSPAIDRAHPALRQLARDLVIADDFTDHCTVPGAVETGRYRSRLCTATWKWYWLGLLRAVALSTRAALSCIDPIISPRRRLVHHARNVGDQPGAAFLFGDASGQYDEHVSFAARGVDDGRVVVVFGDVTGLVGHARRGGQSGGDAVVEALRREDLDHPLAGSAVQEFVLGDQPQEQHQVVSRRHVILAGLKSLRVFDSAQHLDVLRAELAHQFGDAFGLDLLDQQVRGQVAAPGDHPVDQDDDRHRLPNAIVNLLVAVVVPVQPVFAAVDYAVELVFDLDRLVEGDLFPVGAPKDLHHHRQFHRARRVEAGALVDEQGLFRLEVVNGHAHQLGAARGDQPIDLRFRALQRALRPLGRLLGARARRQDEEIGQQQYQKTCPHCLTSSENAPRRRRIYSSRDRYVTNKFGAYVARFHRFRVSLIAT